MSETHAKSGNRSVFIKNKSKQAKELNFINHNPQYCIHLSAILHTLISSVNKLLSRSHRRSLYTNLKERRLRIITRYNALLGRNKLQAWDEFDDCSLYRLLPFGILGGTGKLDQ